MNYLNLLARFIPWLIFLNVSTSSAVKPNFLRLSIDDLRPEIGCYGATHMVTPHMDNLADQSMRFDQAYVQQAVCLPSRISLFTGMRPNSTGVHDLQTKFRVTIPDAVTLPQHFAAHGYKTIGMGKVFHDEQWGEWSQWIDTNKLSGVKPYQKPETQEKIKALRQEAKQKGLKGAQLRRYIMGPAFEKADVPDGMYHDAAMTSRAIEALKEVKDQAFFMVVGYKKPHLPFVAPRQYWDLYDFDAIQLPENYYAPKGAPRIAQMSWGELRAYSGIPQKGPVDNMTARHLIHGYYATVSFVDAQIGRLMGALKKEGLAENTIVILFGDHGFKIGEHAMWCKHTNYEIDTRVPFLIRTPWPSLKADSTAALVELLDLYPTLCDLAGLPTPDQCEGSSLLPLLKDSQAPWTDLAYSQYPRHGGVVGYSVKSPSAR
ncbi:MAG: sulfatase [Verrucomicrobiota bacterium]|nr:sulfatase [Verrucomicrobiota bacterium]